MQPTTPSTLNSRIGLFLCMFLGGAWGLLLSTLIFRINSMHSLLQVFGIALPLAFGGSMLVGIAFNRMLKFWKIVRLLIAVIAVMLGLPFGFLWGWAESWINPIQLFAETGDVLWSVEGMFVLAGLLAGMWPKWTLPFLRPFGNLLGVLLEPPARFFEAMGRGLVWLVTLPIRAIQSLFVAMQEAWTHIPRITLPQRAPRPTNNDNNHSTPPAPRVKRLRAPKPARSTSKNQTNNSADGPRVVGVIEDRCPYCFDIVKKSDPRGIHVCEVCGTPHHADCWAVTGKCQMPHLNT